MGNLPTLHTWGAETKIYKKKSMSKMTWSARQVQAVRPAKEARPGARVHLPGTLSPGLGQGEAGSVLVPWGCPGAAPECRGPGLQASGRAPRVPGTAPCVPCIPLLRTCDQVCYKRGTEDTAVPNDSREQW